MWKGDEAMSTQTMKVEQQMHRWHWAPDVTWTFVWVIGGLFFVLTSAYIPA